MEERTTRKSVSMTLSDHSIYSWSVIFPSRLEQIEKSALSAATQDAAHEDVEPCTCSRGKALLSQAPISLSDKNTENVPSPSPVELEDLPHNIDFRCEVEDHFNLWRENIDHQLKKFERCWDIQRGWKAKRPFEGSRMEEFLRSKYNSADKLLRELEDVLKILTAKSPNWRLTIDRLIWVAGMQAEIDRIFQYFYTRA